jgi:hypothetical protein
LTEPPFGELEITVRLIAKWRTFGSKSDALFGPS